LAIQNATTTQQHADLRANLKAYAEQLTALTAEAVPDLIEASNVITRGICQFRGFCRSNPAKSCLDVMEQEGIRNQTALPDGKYWITPELKSDGFSRFPVSQIQCLMSGHGGGWMLLFDDSRVDTVLQTIEPALTNTPFREVLAFTTKDLQESRTGRRTYLYFVDDSQPSRSRGFTPTEMINSPWVGQDANGKLQENDFPQRAVHNRYKFFGKPSYRVTDTLFVLDDGDIGPRDCRLGKPSQGKGTCFFEGESAKFAQTCYDIKGLISFGCSDDQISFTQCGTCRYSGYGDKTSLIQNSVVRVLYAR
jgi:hypothetical protein